MIFENSINNISLSNAQNALSSIKKQIKEFFVEPEQKDIANLHLDIVGTETLTMISDVTDNYVETNVAYQDQISLKPIVYIVNGEIGELSWYKKSEENSILAAMPSKLTPVVEFAPSVSRSLKQYQDKAMKIIGFVDSVDNIATRFLKSGETVINEDGEEEVVDSKQTKAYLYFRYLRDRRTPVNIKTAWRILKNYVITNVELHQTGTVDKTSIKITFKEFKETKIGDPIKFDAKQFSGRLESQKEEMEKKGRITDYELGKADAYNYRGFNPRREE